MKRFTTLTILIIFAATVFSACAESLAEPSANGESTSKLGQNRDAAGTAPVKDLDYYLSFDEGVYAIDTTELALEVKDNLVYLRAPDMADATYGLAITFETDSHVRPIKITYYNGSVACTVTYYDYPAKGELKYYDWYYSETKGDWDGNASYVKEEITYYENGQVKRHILRDTQNETVFVVSDENYDEDGNSIENAKQR